jgi:cytochrome c5
MAAPRTLQLAASALLTALVAGSGSAQDSLATAGTSPPAPDPVAGRAYFIGARPFANGASPCGACHAIGGAGAPSAASLAPELSKSFEGLDAETVAGLLADPPFPTMAPFYGPHPLTPAETVDVAAFLLQVAGQPAPGGAAFAGWAALVTAGLLALLALGARRHKGPTRTRLVPVPRVPRPSRPTPPTLTTGESRRATGGTR